MVGSCVLRLNVMEMVILVNKVKTSVIKCLYKDTLVNDLLLRSPPRDQPIGLCYFIFNIF